MTWFLVELTTIVKTATGSIKSRTLKLDDVVALIEKCDFADEED